MKILICSLVAVASVVLSGAVFAASAGDQDLQITGTIVEFSMNYLVVETPNKERWEFGVECGLKPKVGEKGTLHYYITGRGKFIACTFEKASKADKGSKKR